MTRDLRSFTSLRIALVVLGGVTAVPQAQPGPAFFLRSIHNPAERSESRPDVLDAPILPGSVMKAVTLVAALDSQTIEPDTARMCRRTVTVEGRRYTCSHPDLKRPLTPAEALAHSCNDYFVSLAPRLPRAAVNDVRTRLGLPPIPATANLAASLVGLDGPRITPRTLLDVLARLTGADDTRAVAMSEATRRVLIDGMRGAARYGSASAIGARGIAALAKTGTAPMPGGSFLGIVVALEPADKPTRGVVVVAPGAAGLDAAAIAADLLGRGGPSGPPAGRSDHPVADPARQSPRSTGGSKDPPLQGSKDPPLQVKVGNRVTTLNLEDYIARVLAGEGQPRAADGAQQALAITARTFAMANRGRHRREGYDFCDTTHCQVIRTATDTTRRAAAATAGRVLVHEGQPATVFYSALCGGRSEIASEVWPGAIDYASRSKEDDACEDEPAWDSEIRSDQIERALRNAGHRGDRLRDLRIVQRNASGRVSRLRIEGFTPGEISGHDFRMAVGRVAGWQLMKSTSFDVRRTSTGYRFHGRGFGHGVGLCVIGAGRRAALGGSADEILRFYFPTLSVATFGSASTATTAAAAPPRAAPADTRADVLIALPWGEEGERSRIAQLVRTARDQIAAATTVRPPASIRVTVHPTVEAFGRATGQPWWVSGATDGRQIDLLPLTILRQQGQLERTIRHEVAHVLIDEPLSRRPLWVREGAAFYFAAVANTADPPARGSCPKDDEFLRPISAGAHRDAYARAEACFRRAIADGKPWRDVK